MSRVARAVAPLTVIAALATACGAEPEDDASFALQGGATTSLQPAGRHAFALPAANLPLGRIDRFTSGDFTFGRSWVYAGAQATGMDGLGPTFNALSCAGCHERDGRGQPPASPDAAMTSMLIRLSVPGVGPDGGPVPEPRYGGQLNERAVLGLPVEGRASVSYDEQPGAYGDGTPYSLRRPRYEVRDLGYGPMAPDVLMSPRVAPVMIGLGLLEAIPEATLAALADEDDRNGDGISGRANRVWDARTGAPALGRFGWKANQPSAYQQTAGAFLGDMGITSPLFPKENCPEPQAPCLAARTGAGPGETEIDAKSLDEVVFYTRLLAVPGQRNGGDAQVRRGRAAFRSFGCVGCHVETLVTSAAAELPEVSGQTIHPYTDLLLHDLGEALADGRPDFLASGREWRTPPLWGMGLVQTVNGHSTLLHDGRARGAAEAILWHGGEAEASREAFRKAPADVRAALVRFLESL